MYDEIELDDECCPKCGTQMYWSRCNHCDDGWITDLYEQEPLWYDEGDIEICQECHGHGCHRWCPNCGYDALAKSNLTLVPVDGAGPSDIEASADSDRAATEL
jgi:predicted RNA-binding Zn-ribbon protein involved in translation (DUF1610 family)